MNTNVKKRYIYSVVLAKSLINNGYNCIGIGFNAKKQKYYWVFDADEIQTFVNR